MPPKLGWIRWLPVMKGSLSKLLVQKPTQSHLNHLVQKTLSELISKFKDSTSPVNCVVYDSLLPWALDVARKSGIYGKVFLTNSASICSMYLHIDHGRQTFPVKQETELVLRGLLSLALSELPSFLAQPARNSAYLAVTMENFRCLEKKMTRCSATVLKSWKLLQINYNNQMVAVELVTYLGAVHQKGELLLQNKSN
uniref:Uncharacterized protein n=1 Tax=Quercus lobata TaxID=97700 RepID=A0A7N2MPN9_QUELO